MDFHKLHLKKHTSFEKLLKWTSFFFNKVALESIICNFAAFLFMRRWADQRYMLHVWYVTYIDGLVQERHNSISYALEWRLSCTNPLICYWMLLYAVECNNMYFRFSYALNPEICHDVNFVIICGTVGCHIDNLQWQQWQQSWLHDSFQLAVYILSWLFIIKSYDNTPFL